jgi:general secretion pathway protein G
MKTGLPVKALVLLLPAAALIPEAGCSVCDYKKSDWARLYIGSVGGALKLHYGKLGRYPSTEEGLQALVDHHVLESVPLDPWGNRYQYSLRDGKVALRSWGADGRPGGFGEEADIEFRDAISELGTGR